ncbi:MAG: DUF4097 domain-containing protein [Candidatus Acetothermia bacterium]|jgi:DUF4097 and DUF4098 domain-containing protein YvlB|nr:DUF4097 domain-containing protein [Candidatus Acetothermia bacterium]MDH7504973.1 DUF4097 family beta strand repeat-containing protein [Candidatus Acetothermia bacterium]
MWPFKATVGDSFERTLEVSGPVKLEVETGSGDISVKRGPEGQVRVRARFEVRAGGEEEARRLAAQIKADPPIKQLGKTIKIGDLEKYRAAALLRHPSVVMEFDIEAPAETAVELDSGSGDQRVSGLKGPVSADTGSGDVEISEIEGEVKIDTGSGSVAARDIAGDIEVDASSGDVRLARIGGDIDIDVSSGDVALKDVRGALEVDAGSGDVTVDSTIAAGTSWEIDTGSGDVSLALPRGTRASIRAETGSGEVESDFPLATSRKGEIGSSEDAGEEGEPRIRVETGSGDIRIKAS